MASILVGNVDRTSQLSDWTIQRRRQDEAPTLTCHFPSGKSFTQPLDACRVEPTRDLGPSLLLRHGSAVTKNIEQAQIYGERFVVVTFAGSPKQYVYKMDSILIAPLSRLKDTAAFQYFTAVAADRVAAATNETELQLADNVQRQLHKLPASAESVLHAYCLGENKARQNAGDLIYPFGINASQLRAVEQAFAAQISMVEGPPGTGKTQTILNILANILMRGQTVAVLSNNNSAVDNIFEKLERDGVGHLMAKLGNRKKREEFFQSLPPQPAEKPELAPKAQSIQQLLTRLRTLLDAENLRHQLTAEINELSIEQAYLEDWQNRHDVDLGANAALAKRYRLSPSSTTDLMAYLAHLEERRIGIWQRIELAHQFRIFRIKPFAELHARRAFQHGLQAHYYATLRRAKEEALALCESTLEEGGFKELMGRLTKGSMQLLKQHLHDHAEGEGDFDAVNYQKRFDVFVKRFPILASSTHSIVNSLPAGTLLDYVIIDEASQQDIVPGILALGCARNLVIVGDSRQLPHIPSGIERSPPATHYDCERFSLMESCVRLFGDTLPRTLLKEHYRCHPRIIQFCNQQFYDNALIPMTKIEGASPLRLVVTAKGNHTRANTNLREIDSILSTLEEASGGDEVMWIEKDGRGFIAPFRSQVNLADAHLPVDFAKNTVHKFQGRECREIVFSTVLDKKQSSQRRLDFVDDPRMINVAVSRAKCRFTLVTGDEVFSGTNGYIAALMRYIEYYAEEADVVRAPVVSAFDLLYREYDKSLQRLRAKLDPKDSRFRSEQIVAQLLRDALEDEALAALTWHQQVALNQVVSASNGGLTDRERDFIQNGSSCDFVIYFKVGKRPVGVIEVDGGQHAGTDQRLRDGLKDSVLAKSGLSILRLTTVESSVEKKISAFLTNWARSTADG